MLDADPEKQLLCTQVDVQARGAGVATGLVRKSGVHVGFVGTLVLRRANVSVNPHQGASRLPCFGDEVRRGRMKSRCHGPDESEGWFHNLAPVAVSVGLEPLSPVVLRQIL